MAMQIGKFFSEISKKTTQQTVKISPELSALQKTVKDTFSQNIDDLQKFTTVEIPKSVAAQNDALKCLEQLVNKAKSSIK